MAPHWLTLCSAILIVASFPPWGLSFLIWVSLLPWFFALKKTSNSKQALTQGVLLSVLINLLGFYWVASVLHEFGGLPWVLSILGFLLFSLIGQPQFILLAPVIRFFLQKPTPQPNAVSLLEWIGLTLFYVGSDWLIPKLFRDTLGHAFYSSPNLRQIADLGGAHLITALIFLVNATVIHVVLNRKKIHWAIPHITFATFALISAEIYGNLRNKQIQEQINHPVYSIQGTAIQANIGDFDKVAAEQGLIGAAEKVLNTYFSLSDSALNMTKKPDFLVWPETAYPSTFRNPNTRSELVRDQKLETFVRSRKIPLLFGGYDTWNQKDFNALFVIDPNSNGSTDLQIYRKNILLLFGEYIPGADQFKLIRDTFPQVGNFGRGVGPELVSIPIPHAPSGQIKTSPVICYEALFPHYVVEAARKGSQMILNITNDSWFGPYGEPPLHLALVTFRSIETRLPQFRSTNTGISALILPDGELANQTSIGKKEILNVEIPIIQSIPTLFKNWGDWFGPFSFTLGVTLLGMLNRLKLKQLKLG